MIQEIRKKSFLRTLPAIILCLIIAGGLLFFSGLPTYLSEPIPVSQADMSSGRSYHVKDSVSYLYAYFMEQTTTRRSVTTTTGYGYITETPDASQYIGLWAEKAVMRVMERRWTDQDPFMDGTKQGDPDPIPVEGVLRPLKADEQQFYDRQVGKLVERYNLSDSAFARYVLDTSAFDAMWLMVGGAAIALLVAIVLLIQSRRSVAKALQKAINLSDDPAQAEAALDELYHNGTELFKGFRMNGEWFMHTTSLTGNIIPSQDIVWAYRKEITTRHGLLIKTTNYQVCVADKAKVHAIPVTKNQTTVMLEAIAAHAPQAVIGFNRELEKLYRKDPANFIANAQAWSADHQAQTEEA